MKTMTDRVSHVLSHNFQRSAARMAQLQVILQEQAEDPGLWFEAETAPEAYLQKALRRLHEAIEGKTAEECAKAVLD